MLKDTVILSGETLFDMAIREYGHMQGVAQLANDNGISLTGVAVPGSNLKIDTSVIYDLPVVTIAKQTTIAPNEVVVETWQNIFDIAVQEYGDLMGLKNLIFDNNKGLTNTVTPGESLKVRNKKVNKLVVDFLKGKALKIATGLTPEENENLKPEGIEYWAIEVDFVVS